MSANIKDDKVNIFIRESQLIEARSFLGSGLYSAMQEDFEDITKSFTNPEYTALMFGANYTNYAGVDVIFNGYANALIYFSYARFLLQQQLNVSRFGLESIQDTISEDAPVAQIRTKSKEALSVALQYQKDTSLFLESKNKETPPPYPEYNRNETKPKKTSFTFFKL